MREWAARDPDAFWPYWMQGKGVGWTATGLPGAVEEGLLGRDAAAGSTAWPFTLSAWVRDDATGEWTAAERQAPDAVVFDLRSGYLPLPRARIPSRRLPLTVEYLVASASSSFPDGVAVYRARVTNPANHARRATLVLAVRPYLVDGRVGEVRALHWERDVVWVNDSIPVAPERVPAERVAADLDCDGRDVSRHLLEASGGPTCGSPMGTLLGGAFVFPLTLPPRSSESVALLAPLAPVASGPAVVPEFRRLGVEELSARAAAQWRARLLALPLEVPDSAVMQALRASLANILIARDGDLPYAGPHVARALPLPEAAYISAALLRMGAASLVAPGLPGLWPVPAAERGLPPAEAADWDRHGQAIFAAGEYARFTADTALVRKQWAAVQRSVDYLRRARASMARAESHGTVVFGLLPASVAAFPLGGAEGHHYWDDFWAIRGFEDAAQLATIAAHERDAAQMREEAEALRRAVRVSYRQTMLVSRNTWIPSGPEDLEDPAAARSTCAGLWPGAGLEPEDTIVRRSFDHYWESWIRPYGGAYLQRGRFWPYGLEIGACELFLDRPQRAHAILRWHLEHPTPPGAYSWAEQVDTTAFTYAGGDMPSAWVAADYVNLVRSMLLHERGDTLVLGAGLLPGWLSAGGVRATSAPSHFGPVSFRVSGDAGSGHVVWEIEGAGAVRLVAPAGREIVQVEVDGAWVRQVDRARAVTVPPGSGRVELRLARP